MQKNDKIIDFLKDVFIFKDLSRDDIKVFLSICQPVSFKQGETIVREGDEGTSMFIILEGTVEVSKSLTLKVKGSLTEDEKILTRISADDHAFFGEVVLFEKPVRTASIVALTDCSFLRVERNDFHNFAEENPLIGYRLVRNIAEALCRRFRKADEDTIKLTTALSIALSQR